MEIFALYYNVCARTVIIMRKLNPNVKLNYEIIKLSKIFLPKVYQRSHIHAYFEYAPIHYVA